MALADRPLLPPATVNRLRAMRDLLRQAHEMRQRIDDGIAELRQLLGALDDEPEGGRDDGAA